MGLFFRDGQKIFAQGEPAESMFITAAIKGITMLRNRAASSRADSKTTIPTNSDSLLDTT